MKILTWNCNGIRARFPLIKKIIELEKPDLLFLQETKIEDKIFPEKEFHNLGYEFLFYRGEKSYNGVACISKVPFGDYGYKNWYDIEDCRHIFVKIKNTTIHNFYVPAGGDIPDRFENLKFGHKLDFIAEVTDYFEKNTPVKALLVGDLNVAPLVSDVWSTKQLKNVVSHTDIERKKIIDMQKKGGWLDAVREFFGPEQVLYSWWSYRARNYIESDRGRRLDHIWVSIDLASKIEKVEIHKNTRGWEKPSDHVPITLQLL